MLVVAELNSSTMPRLDLVARFLDARNIMFFCTQEGGSTLELYQLRSAWVL